jgi:hypothetical protein
MIRFRPLVLVAAVWMTAIVPALAGAQELSANDRAKLVQYLKTTRDQVLAEAAALNDAQWTFKPGPDRWSVGEVVEHLALAEAFLFDVQQKVMAGPAATAEQRAGTQGQDEMVLKVIPDRTKKVNAPEPLQPTTRLGTQVEVVAAFTERRAKTLDYASKTTDDLRGRIASSPMGPLDAYQWLLFTAAHNERHLAQIREVKGHAGFPKVKTQ